MYIIIRLGEWFFLFFCLPFLKGETRRGEGFKSSCASHHPSFGKGGQNNKQKNPQFLTGYCMYSDIYFLVLALTFDCTMIFIFLSPRNLFRKHAKTTPIIYQITKVMMISKMPFPRVAWVITYTGWRKCNQNIQSINFCIPVGVIAIATAHTKWMNETKQPKTNPALNLLSMCFFI